MPGSQGETPFCFSNVLLEAYSLSFSKSVPKKNMTVKFLGATSVVSSILFSSRILEVKSPNSKQCIIHYFVLPIIPVKYFGHSFTCNDIMETLQENRVKHWFTTLITRSGGACKEFWWTTNLLSVGICRKAPPHHCGRMQAGNTV